MKTDAINHRLTTIYPAPPKYRQPSLPQTLSKVDSARLRYYINRPFNSVVFGRRQELLGVAVAALGVGLPGLICWAKYVLEKKNK